MAAIFGTPLASILIGLELLLFEMKPRSLVPVASMWSFVLVLLVFCGLYSQFFRWCCFFLRFLSLEFLRFSVFATYSTLRSPKYLIYASFLCLSLYLQYLPAWHLLFGL